MRAGESDSSEAEKIFREAFEAERERSLLLKSQLEAALTEKLKSQGGGGGMKITVEGIGPLSPEEAGGKATWREAYEAAKAKTDSMEKQLQSAQSLGAAAPAPAPAAAPAPPAIEPEVVGQAAPQQQSQLDNPLPFLGADAVKDVEGFKKLELLADNTIEEEAALRLIAVPVLGRDPTKETTSLPPLSQVRETLGSDQFVVSDVVAFERVYVLKGTLAAGAQPGAALEAMRGRLRGTGAELFLQKSKRDGELVVFVMLQEDVSQSEVAWWQWGIAVVSLLATAVSVNITTFNVTTLTEAQTQSMAPEQMMDIATKSIPTAAGIFAVIAVQEVARRVAAGSYGVELSPPYFVPVWPFPSVGAFGAVSRRLSTVPNEEASIGMSLASSLAGLAASLLIILVGFSMGSDGVVNLNYQLLPAALKVILKPFLGTASLTQAPDPFLDPVAVAFPSNSVLIGGIVGLIIVGLNLLPLGRLDGGVMVKSVFGARTGNLFGFLALGLLLLGSTAPTEASLLCTTFGFYAIIFQNGTENPPRDGVTEVDGSVKVLAMLLVVLGILLAIPGSFFPQL